MIPDSKMLNRIAAGRGDVRIRIPAAVGGDMGQPQETKSQSSIIRDHFKQPLFRIFVPF